MSKIEIHTSLQVAHKVLKAIEKIIPKEIAKDCRIESWSNGREQGLCLECYSLPCSIKKIIFSEARNSDQILVVHGDNYSFCYQTNQPNEEIWAKNRKYFDPDHYSEVAKYIVGLLK